MVNNIKIEKWNISKLKKWDKNPREISESGLRRLMVQLKKLGQYKPLVVTKEGVVVGGNMRYEAFKRLGVTDVYVSIIDPKDENELFEYALSDNDRAGYYDDDLLANMLPNFDIDWVNYGVDMREPMSLKSLVDLGISAREDEAPAVDLIGEPVSKQGTVYKLGRHFLMCGDSTKEEDFSKLMNGKKANLIFTDPPYNVNYTAPGGLDYKSKKYEGSGSIMNDNQTDEEALTFFVDALNNFYKFSLDNAPIYWWFANKNNAINRQAFELSGYHMSQVIIWLKNSMVFSRGQDYHRMYEPCMFGWKKNITHFKNKSIKNYTDVFNLDVDDFSILMDVWYQHRDKTTEYVHPTQKPVRLAERAFKRSSKAGDIVLDGFGGSGSVLIACEQMDRTCYMMEFDNRYVDVIRKRYANFIGQGDLWEKITPKI